MAVFAGTKKIKGINDAVTLLDITEQFTASKSWATGNTGSREGEDTDNSKYYYEQAKFEAEKASLYSSVTLPELYLDNNGYLMCKQGNNFTVSVNENNELIVEVG